MLTGAFGPYAAALIVIAASTAIGAGIVAASGRREWSWAAPAVGLAAATVIAWWAVRLPGHGSTALICVLVAAIAGGVLAWRRMPGLRGDLGRGAWPLLGALVVASIPFAVEGHFGVLGTGFNVDMSQHLFAADWLADPSGAAPGLYEQGYPLGPHALAVAMAEVSGELTTAFSGVTIAVPALLALAALGACAELTRWRATAIALLTGFAYLGASYLAQGSFKELFEATFLVALAIWLREVTRGEGGWRAGLPVAVLGAGGLYAYSGPGLAWLGGTAGLWGLFELWRRRERVGETIFRVAPAVLGGAVALALLAAPELDRIIDFGGSVGTVSEKADATLLADRGGSSDEAKQSIIAVGALRDSKPEFDDDLGNLFGQNSPLEALNIWPSGDFRVAPGDGAVPAAIFYLGALLGAVALAIGLAWAVRESETALVAALAVAIAIWLAARIGSTPYTTAKALQMIAPVTMLIAARGVLDPGWLSGLRGRSQHLRAAVAAGFVAGAALSSGLALANAPVGPKEYTPGVFALSDDLRFVVLYIDDELYSDERGEEFYGWDLREANGSVVEPISAASPDEVFGPISAMTLDPEPPFGGLEKVAESDGVTLWRSTNRDRPIVLGDG